MSKEVMQQALEALVLNNAEWKSLADSGDSGYWKAEDQDHYQQTNKAITVLETELAKPDFWEGYVPEPVKPKEDVTLIDEGKTAQQEFVSPGGGYVPAIPAQQRPIKTFHGGKAWPVQKPAQQEPVADAFEQLMREADKPTQVLQQGVAEYVDALIKGTHEITSVTIRPKRTWVGLTDEEIEKLITDAGFTRSDLLMMGACIDQIARLVEAKLRSKNEDRN